MNMILVTGGLGFIGSNFVRMFLLGKFPELKNSKVVVLDLQTYAGKLSNLAEFIESKDLEIVIGDICDGVLVDGLVEKCDLIVHFAAESHVDRSITGPDVFVRTNVLGTNTLLRSASKWSKRILIVSTDEVYGSLENEDATESYPLHPSSPYSASKASSDLLGLAYFNTYGTDMIITRSANNYGMNQDREKLIPLAITKILENQKIPVYGTGLNVRNWLHVEDHCNGIYAALIRGKAGEIFNFGSTDYLKNLEICELLLDYAGKKYDELEFVSDRKGHDFRYGIDYEKACSQLGWKPEHKISDSVAKLFEWYRL